MLEKYKDLIRTLEEEIKYNENILSHKKNLEATLWGLEEQSKMPENTSKEDQTELNEQMNLCRSKIINCNSLLKAHIKKIESIIIGSISENEECNTCSK